MDANRDVDAEWIVVDDGSGPEFDRVFKDLHADVHVLRLSENRRQGAARNVGLRAARGTWVKFLDADDQLDGGHLKALLSGSQGMPETAIAFAPTLHVFSSGETRVNETWRKLARDPNAQLERHLFRPFLHHCGALFPRGLLERLDGYDEALVTDEDGDLLIRILRAGSHFVACPEVNYLYHHGRGTDRVSSDDEAAKLSARREVCRKLMKSYQDSGEEMPPEIRRALAMRLDRIAMAYWVSHEDAARELLSEARSLAPGYTPAGRWPVRFLRKFAGPSVTIKVTRFARAARGRPAGGAQG